MSRLISDILEAKEPEFSHNLKEWERLANFPAVDIRMTLEMKRDIKHLLGELGLDQEDTTGSELYHSLIKRYNQDNNNIAKLLKITPEDTPQQYSKKVAVHATKILSKYKVWALKSGVARKIIKELPPKKMMRICGYRSIDALLKRESPSVLIILGSLCDKEYATKVAAKYKKVKVSDFGEIPIKVIVAAVKDVNKIRAKGVAELQLVHPSPVTGEVAILPPKRRYRGDTLLLLSSIIEVARMISMYSSYFRLLSVYPNFGGKISETMMSDLAISSKGKVKTGWSSLHAMASQGNLSADLDLGPHIFSDDLSLPTISDIEELEFWHGRQHIFFHGNQNNVSCNVLDIAVSMVYELPKAKSLKVYGQSYVWDNLISRYLVYEPIRKLVINLG